jgi:hypothetical protein
MGDHFVRNNRQTEGSSAVGQSSHADSQKNLNP